MYLVSLSLLAHRHWRADMSMWCIELEIWLVEQCYPQTLPLPTERGVMLYNIMHIIDPGEISIHIILKKKFRDFPDNKIYIEIKKIWRFTQDAYKLIISPSRNAQFHSLISLVRKF